MVEKYNKWFLYLIAFLSFYIGWSIINSDKLVFRGVTLDISEFWKHWILGTIFILFSLIIIYFKRKEK